MRGGRRRVDANQADPVAALRDRTWALAEQWEQLGWPWLAAAIKGAVALGKGEH